MARGVCFRSASLARGLRRREKEAVADFASSWEWDLNRVET